MGDDVLSAEGLIAFAKEEAGGLDDFGEDTWQEGLDRVVASLRDESRLNEIGVQVALQQFGQPLANRLRITDWHARHPEIGAAPVPPPVVVVGQPRTGTTILFDLLGQDPRLRVPLSWEVAMPCPPPEAATYDTDPRIAELDANLAMTELLIPGFQAIHPMGALRGQECVGMTAGDMKSMQFQTAFRMPSYAKWLLHEADMGEAMRYHRRFLQLLQWRNPKDRWLLKTPAYLWHLGELFAEYPDAVIVHTHRDPLKVLASVSSLTAHLQRMATDHTDIPEQAAEWVDYIVEGFDRAVAARDDGTVPPGQAIDIAFADLVADPFATIAGIYERIGMPYTAEVEARQRAFLAENPADRHGTHTYTFSATGLDEAAVRARTKNYEERFDVPRERLG